MKALPVALSAIRAGEFVHRSVVALASKAAAGVRRDRLVLAGGPACEYLSASSLFDQASVVNTNRTRSGW
jgi:hypothetical protein